MKSAVLNRLFALALAILVMFSLSTVCVLADGDDTAADESVGLTSSAPAEGDTDGEDANDASVETDGETGDDASTKTTGEAAEPTTGETETKSVNWDLIVTLSIIGLGIIVFLLFFFINKKFNAKVKKTLKELGSELKKIVWSPWRDVKKNTVIVIVISLGAALLIFVLDMLFSKGLAALTTIVHGH